MGLEVEKGLARLLLSLAVLIVVPIVGWTYRTGEGVFGYLCDIDVGGCECSFERSL